MTLPDAVGSLLSIDSRRRMMRPCWWITWSKNTIEIMSRAMLMSMAEVLRIGEVARP